jgi:hypothetical protein
MFAQDDERCESVPVIHGRVIVQPTSKRVNDQRSNDADLLIPAIELHQAAIGRGPHVVAADAAF